jgi:hypothetical protein
MTDIIRPESHETDTAARRIAPSILPRGWEHREPGGRDYGIDMQVELFAGGKSTGEMLLFQIKGTTKEIDDNHPIPFDLPVKTLKYAEMFVVPFICVLCPVNTEPHRAYFVWLQEYIKVVLDFENLTWRENTKSVRVSFLPENRLPNAAGKLELVAGEPQRIRDWTQVGRLHHELKWALAYLDVENINTPRSREQVERSRFIIGQIEQLKSLYRHPAGFWVKQFTHRLVKLIDLIERGGPYTLKDLQFLGAVNAVPEEFGAEHEMVLGMIFNHLHLATAGIMTTFAQYFDDGLKRGAIMF